MAASKFHSIKSLKAIAFLCRLCVLGFTAVARGMHKMSWNRWLLVAFLRWNAIIWLSIHRVNIYKWAVIIPFDCVLEKTKNQNIMDYDLVYVKSSSQVPKIFGIFQRHTHTSTLTWHTWHVTHMAFLLIKVVQHQNKSSLQDFRWKFSAKVLISLVENPRKTNLSFRLIIRFHKFNSFNSF